MSAFRDAVALICPACGAPNKPTAHIDEAEAICRRCRYRWTLTIPERRPHA